MAGSTKLESLQCHEVAAFAKFCSGEQECTFDRAVEAGSKSANVIEE